VLLIPVRTLSFLVMGTAFNLAQMFNIRTLVTTYQIYYAWYWNEWIETLHFLLMHSARFLFGWPLLYLRHLRTLSGSAEMLHTWWSLQKKTESSSLYVTQLNLLIIDYHVTFSLLQGFMNSEKSLYQTHLWDNVVDFNGSSGRYHSFEHRSPCL
jgi:hypothetical protein